MINSKERASLRALANKVKPSVNIGKDGISENLIKQVEVEIYNKELIKIRVNQNCDKTAKEMINELAEKIDAIPVMAPGNIIVLYKYSEKENIDHIEYK